MVDIHTHILPNIDDGAESIEISVEMIKTAKSRGTEKIVLTPHYPNKLYGRSDNGNGEDFIKYMNYFIEKIHSHIDGITLYPGAEIFCGRHIFDMISQKSVITINGGNYVLAEFYEDAEFAFIKSTVEAFVENGYIPIIAHIERYGHIMHNIPRVKELKKIGCLVQVTALCFLGNDPYGSTSTVRELLKEGLVDVVASDAHGIYTRTTDMSDAAAEIAVRYSREYANSLFNVVPNNIINNQIAK